MNPQSDLRNRVALNWTVEDVADRISLMAQGKLEAEDLAHWQRSIVEQKT